MVKSVKLRLLYLFNALIMVPLLTGCPLSGDKWRFDEESMLIVEGDDICLSVNNPKDYQPKNIAINPRGTDPKDEKMVFNPALHLTGNQLCIPPSFYHFPDNGQFVISVTLTSKDNRREPRRLVAALEISDGNISTLPLTDKEVVRPYSEMTR